MVRERTGIQVSNPKKNFRSASCTMMGRQSWTVHRPLAIITPPARASRVLIAPCRGIAERMALW